MKGFGIVLALASAAILLICGPPALAQGQNTYLDLQSSIGGGDASNFVFAETPGTSLAVAQVVHDPGSCGGLDCAVAIRLKTGLRAARPRNILRQGVRLLIRLPCC